MKVLLVGFTKIAYMPYMHFYLDQLRSTGHQVSLVYWDRDGMPDANVPEGVEAFRFAFTVMDSAPIIRKIVPFLKYQAFVKRLLKNKSFERVVILSTLPGILLSRFLTRQFDAKYIFDYRDVTYERFRIFKLKVHQLVDHSIFTFVSSDAFRALLPDRKNILTTHNISPDFYKKKNELDSCRRFEIPLRIRFWGFIRHEKINRIIIDAISRDDRFELHYHGREQDEANNLKNYCQSIGAQNIYFHGEYKPEDRHGFAMETDLLHNIYANDTTRYALGNKYYDGLIHKIPQICNEGSYMGERVEMDGVGCAIDPGNCGFCDQIFNFYKALQWTEFETNCEETLKKVLIEYEESSETLRAIFDERG